MPNKTLCLSYPLVEEDGASDSIISVVDIVCHQPHCFYRTEGMWQQWAQKRSMGQTCGFSGCLSNSCRLLHVVSHFSSYPEDKRRRYVLDVTSVV